MIPRPGVPHHQGSPTPTRAGLRVRPGSSPILRRRPRADHQAMEPDLPPDQSPPPAEEQLPASPTDPLPDAGDEPLAPEPTAAPEETPPPPPLPPSDPGHGHGSGEGGVWAPPFQFLRSKHERKL